MQNNLTWSFSNIWNQSLANNSLREIKARDHLWASEIGGSYCDIFLKMKGTQYSNPPNARSLRKFETGNVFEWIVEMILRRAGLYESKQEYIEVKYPGLLKVTGRLDYIAGGTPDWEASKESVMNSDLPDFIKHAAKNVTNSLAEKYPSGLKSVILEVKSVGSNMFHRYEFFKMADPKHELQLYHYLTGLNMPEGHIVYISKDDLSLAEIGVMNPSSVGERYKKEIEKMTNYVNTNTMPPLESAIVFNDMTGKVSINYKIGYSGYLTLLYGYKNQAEYEEKYKPIAARWNRVLKRIYEGKDLTEDNRLAVKEMSDEFPNMDELIEIGKLRSQVKDEEDYDK